MLKYCTSHSGFKPGVGKLFDWWGHIEFYNLTDGAGSGVDGVF